MSVEYTIIQPAAEPVRGTLDWPESPGYDRIAGFVRPVLSDDWEHVHVLFGGVCTDMFVSATGALSTRTRPMLPVNAAATIIYRAAWMLQHPDTSPDSLPAIHGTAV